MFFSLLETEDYGSSITKFLESLIRADISELPRDIAHRALKQMRTKWHNKGIIPTKYVTQCGA